MGLIGGTITITPEIYLLWDGEPIEALGIGKFLISATVGSTTRRTKSGGNSKKARRYTRRPPRVSGAELKFSIPDQTVALMFTELFERNARPKITVGFRSDEVASGRGAAVGTYKIDTVAWTYPNTDLIQLTLMGKVDRYLGLAAYRAPRYFENKTVREIIQKIADDHKIDVQFDDDLPDAKVSVSSPNAESDFLFLDRIAGMVGLSGFSLEPLGYQPQASDTEDILEVSARRRALAAADPFARGLGAYARTVMKFSKMPAFLGRTRGTKKEPTITLAYGPGIVGTGVSSASSLILKVSQLSVKIPHLGANIASSSKISSDNTISSLQLRVLPRHSDPEDKLTVIDVVSGTIAGSAQVPGIAAASVGKQRSTSASTQYVRTDNELPDGRTTHIMYTSGLPPAVSNDLALAARASMRTRELGLLGEVDVTLNPGFPFLNSPGEVNLIGTYVHDGVYGVDEAVHTYDSQAGLVTTLKLLRISKHNRDRTKADGSGSSDLIMRVLRRHDDKHDEEVLINVKTGRIVTRVVSRVSSDVTDRVQE